MDGRHLLGAAGGPPPRAAGANRNKPKIVMVAVLVLAMLLLLLLTAAAVSLAPHDCAPLRAIYRRHMFLMICVLTSTTTGCVFAWMSVTAPTEAIRRSYADATVRCFTLLAINLYLASLSNLPDAEDATA